MSQFLFKININRTNKKPRTKIDTSNWPMLIECQWFATFVKPCKEKILLEIHGSDKGGYLLQENVHDWSRITPQDIAYLNNTFSKCPSWLCDQKPITCCTGRQKVGPWEQRLREMRPMLKKMNEDYFAPKKMELEFVGKFGHQICVTDFFVIQKLRENGEIPDEEYEKKYAQKVEEFYNA